MTLAGISYQQGLVNILMLMNLEVTKRQIVTGKKEGFLVEINGSFD